MTITRPESDIVGIVEAAYAIDANDETWLSGLIEAVRPAAEDGLGMIAYLYDTAERPFRVRHLFHDTPVDDAGAQMLLDDGNDEYVRRSWTAPVTAMASETEGFEHHPAVHEVFHPCGIHDLFVINALDPVGVGCWIGAPRRTLSRLDDYERERWNRVAAHVRSALRLRLRLANSRNTAKEEQCRTEAVFRADGTLAHLEGDAESARSALRDAVLSMQRARTSLRSEPDQALPAWRALVRARWSLIDDFQANGERYVVARANSLASVDLQLLTPREAQVAACISMGLTNKEAAYELGISDSTVRVLIVRACEKLRASGRAELIEKYRAEILRS